MKFKSILLSAAMVLFALNMFAQDVQNQEDPKDPVYKHIKDAKDYYKQKKYRESAATLQEAINTINDMIGKMILTGMPDDINGMKADPANDQTTSLGTLMGAGMTVARIYQGDQGTLTVTIMPNSPQVEAVNTFLNNPNDYGTETEAGKNIKIGDYKALCKFKNTEDEKVAYMQMTLGSTLISYAGDGFKTEEDFIKCAEKVDYNKLAKSLGIKSEKSE
jgi:hypothetical protein